MAGPVFSGSCQITVRDGVAPGDANTSGGAGLAGGSSTSLTVIVTGIVTLYVPSVTLTSTW